MLQLSFLHPADATGGDMNPMFHGQSGAWQATVSLRLRPGIMRGVGKPWVQMAGPALVAARSDVERVFLDLAILRNAYRS
jgi:hypothetical protein